MKKFILFLPLMACLLIGSTASAAEPMKKCLFVSLIQDPPVLSSRKAILELVDYSKKGDIKILFVQVYRSNKAWFPSTVADSSAFEKASKTLGEDPVAFLIKEAHKNKIEVHAWLNMLSLSANKDAKLLKKYGSDILTRNSQKKQKLEDYKIDNQYFLEPGDPRVKAELLNLVEELLKKYPQFDGIQFDYIRYPDVHPFYGHTALNLKRFKAATGAKSVDEKDKAWKDWKRRQVTELLSALVKKAKAVRPGVQASATGCEPYVRALHEAYQDWPSWIEQGIVDFVTVMNYPVDVREYEKNIKEVRTKVKNMNNVIMAVGAYKMEKLPETFFKQLKVCKTHELKAFAVLHYGNLLQNPALAKILAGWEKEH